MLRLNSSLEAVFVGQPFVLCEETASVLEKLGVYILVLRADARMQLCLKDLIFLCLGDSERLKSVR